LIAKENESVQGVIKNRVSLPALTMILSPPASGISRALSWATAKSLTSIYSIGVIALAGDNVREITTLYQSRDVEFRALGLGTECMIGYIVRFIQPCATT
jgi:hypothetical protein